MRPIYADAERFSLPSTPKDRSSRLPGEEGYPAAGAGAGLGSGVGTTIQQKPGRSRRDHPDGKSQPDPDGWDLVSEHGVMDRRIGVVAPDGDESYKADSADTYRENH